MIHIIHIQIQLLPRFPMIDKSRQWRRVLQSQYPIQYDGIIAYPVKDDILCEWFPKAMVVGRRGNDKLSGYIMFVLEGGLQTQ
jgi:hypothetical protein